MPIVYGILALGKSINLKENVFSEIGSKHILHLYLYSSFVAFIFSLLQVVLFQTTEHQEILRFWLCAKQHVLSNRSGLCGQ